MTKDKIFSAKELIKKLEKKESRLWKSMKKPTIPYFKRIIEELKKINSVENVPNVIKTLEKLKDSCGKNKHIYSDKEVMPQYYPCLLYLLIF